MKKSREFDNILDECLERMLARGETVEQCLSKHSEYANELEPLLRTALNARNAVAIKPRPEFRERARYQFQAALREMEPKKSYSFFSWRPQWAVAIIVVIILLAGGSTVAAANNSMPDEPLYPVKLTTEAVRLKLTPSGVGRDELYVELADRRVDEIIKMASKGKTEQVEKATEKLNEYLVAVGVVNGESAATLSQPAAAPRLQSVEGPKEGEGKTPPAVAEAPRPAAKAPAPEIKVPDKSKDDKSKTDPRAKLKETLEKHAAENREALEKELEKAPESAKPALRRAIESAGKGYEQALKHLD